jgi:hypothetical protein
MFVRVRQSAGSRLHVSIVEARRISGTVKQEHIASLGSIQTPRSIWDRLAFWQRLHERLAKLANRVTDLATIFGQIHARIPMVTADEQRALQLENAEACGGALGRHARHGRRQCRGPQGTGSFRRGKGRRGPISNGKCRCASHGREGPHRDRIKKGENVAGGLKSRTREEWLKRLGWTASDVRATRTYCMQCMRPACGRISCKRFSSATKLEKRGGV